MGRNRTSTDSWPRARLSTSPTWEPVLDRSSWNSHHQHPTDIQLVQPIVHQHDDGLLLPRPILRLLDANIFHRYTWRPRSIDRNILHLRCFSLDPRDSRQLDFRVHTTSEEHLPRQGERCIRLLPINFRSLWESSSEVKWYQCDESWVECGLVPAVKKELNWQRHFRHFKSDERQERSICLLDYLRTTEE